MQILKILAGSFLFASVLVAAAAHAQTAMPPCDGTRAIVRVSTIKDGSSMDKFMAAVEAQKNWYSSHHFQDVIFAAKVLERDPATGTFSNSGKQAMTYHLIPQGAGPDPQHDAAWDAFVKLFSESSTITNTYMSCFPAGVTISAK